MSVGWQVEWRVVDFTGHDSALATSGMQLADRKFAKICVCLIVSGVKKFRKKFVGMEQHLCAQNVCASETKLVFWPNGP